MRTRLSLAVVAAAAVVVGGVSAALAGPLDNGPHESAGVRVRQLAGYVVDLVGVGDAPDTAIVEVQIPLAAIVNEAYSPLEGPVRQNQGDAVGTLRDMIDVADVNVERVGDVFVVGIENLAEFVNSECGSCAPGLGNPIPPIPTPTPVGDEALYRVNRGISVVNAAYARYGAEINNTCGECAPGLGNPIGPIPVGPVGDQGPDA